MARPLLARPSGRGPEPAERLEATERTVRPDLDRLRAAGVSRGGQTQAAQPLLAQGGRVTPLLHYGGVDAQTNLVS